MAPSAGSLESVLQPSHSLLSHTFEDKTVAIEAYLNKPVISTLYSNRRLKTRLDSVAIHELMKLGQLRKLNVGGGWLTSSNIAELKAALPNCAVVDNYADDEW